MEIVVEVRGDHTHAGLRFTVDVERRAEQHAAVDERSVPAVQPQLVGIRVVGDVEIGPVVAVQVLADHTEPGGAHLMWMRPGPLTAGDEAALTVELGDGTRHAFSLPVRRRPLLASAKGRAPLIRPVKRTRAVAKVTGNDAEALLALGRQELDDNEVDQSVATLERVVELRPDGSEGHTWLGRAYLAQLQEASMFQKLGLVKP